MVLFRGALQGENRDWKARQRLGAADRHTFHKGLSLAFSCLARLHVSVCQAVKTFRMYVTKYAHTNHLSTRPKHKQSNTKRSYAHTHTAAKKRVIERLMRPTLWQIFCGAVMSFVATLKSTKDDKKGLGSGRRGKGHGKVADDAEADLEAGEVEDGEEGKVGSAKLRKAATGAAEVGDSESETEKGSEDSGKGKRSGGARGSSSRGSRGEKGLSEAETEADRVEPLDDSDDD